MSHNIEIQDGACIISDAHFSHLRGEFELFLDKHPPKLTLIEKNSKKTIDSKHYYFPLNAKFNLYTKDANSPLAHVTNMQVDGAMVRFGESYTMLEGSFAKIIYGRAHDAVSDVNKMYLTDGTLSEGSTTVIDEEVDFALLDWKGLGNSEQRRQVTKVLDKLYVNYKKTSEVNKGC